MFLSFKAVVFCILYSLPQMTVIHSPMEERGVTCQILQEDYKAADIGYHEPIIKKKKKNVCYDL